MTALAPEVEVARGTSALETTPTILGPEADILITLYQSSLPPP